LACAIGRSAASNGCGPMPGRSDNSEEMSKPTRKRAGRQGGSWKTGPLWRANSCVKIWRGITEGSALELAVPMRTFALVVKRNPLHKIPTGAANAEESSASIVGSNALGYQIPRRRTISVGHQGFREGNFYALRLYHR